MKNTNKGFTLIELLVVIAIIGLLSTLAVVALNNARTKARDAKRIADVKQVQTALELYFNDDLQYPTGATIQLGLDTSAECLDAGGFDTSCTASASNPVYMAVVPEGASANEYYLFTAVSDGTSNTSYQITFTLEQENSTLGGDSCTAEPSGTTCN